MGQLLQIIGWPFRAENQGVMGGTGFLMTIIGFVLTWKGLALAYEQLKKTKSAAEEAAAAVASVKMQLAQYEAAQDVARAIQALDHVRDGAGAGDWEAVGRNYEEVRRCFIRLHANLPSESDEMQNDLQRAAKQINVMMKTIDGMADAGPAPDRAKLLENTRKHVEIASRLQVLIHGKAF